jgi:hypothetical protein
VNPRPERSAVTAAGWRPLPSVASPRAVSSMSEVSPADRTMGVTRASVWSGVWIASTHRPAVRDVAALRAGAVVRCRSLTGQAHSLLRHSGPSPAG